ncbi:MAG TPA: AAA family ATPase [Acidimicrobiales bacterium]|nr:AAA family ATPase [Acidimicrobiales bacterium]
MIEHRAAAPVDLPLGRAPELAALDDLLDRVENAHSVATVLAGEAGAGKSALVEWAHLAGREGREGDVEAGRVAVAEARRRGFLVLRATGVEFERDLPYSGLSGCCGASTGCGSREADGAVDLAAARTLFDRLGARAWSTRGSSARGEATSAGRSLQSRLTEAELRVALAAIVLASAGG